MTPPTTNPPKKLTAKQERFVELFVASLNATKAYKEAYGCSDKVANKNGPALLVNTGIENAIATARTRLSERTEITQDMVLQRLWSIATADARELTEYRRTCCRHCWGDEFGYQLTQKELDQREADARAVWDKRKIKKPTDTFIFIDFLGGVGWDPRKDPNVECPECFGEGVEHEFYHDTRKLSGKAVLLYAGVKRTKDGIEIKTHDATAALIKVGEHLGMFRGTGGSGKTADEQADEVRAALKKMKQSDGLAA